MHGLHPAPPVDTHPASLVPFLAVVVVLAVVLLVGTVLAARR